MLLTIVCFLPPSITLLDKMVPFLADIFNGKWQITITGNLACLPPKLLPGTYTPQDLPSRRSMYQSIFKMPSMRINTVRVKISNLRTNMLRQYIIRTSISCAANYSYSQVPRTHCEKTNPWRSRREAIKPNIPYRRVFKNDQGNSGRNKKSVKGTWTSAVSMFIGIFWCKTLTASHVTTYRWQNLHNSYKYMVQVVIGEQKGEGLRCVPVCVCTALCAYVKTCGRISRVEWFSVWCERYFCNATLPILLPSAEWAPGVFGTPRLIVLPVRILVMTVCSA